MLRGQIYFNYPVKPEELATRLRLVDPRDPHAESPLLELETGWSSQVLGFRSTPISKQKDEREYVLRIAADLTPDGGNVPLASDYLHPIVIGSSELLAVRGFDVQPGIDESTVRIRLSSPVVAAVARTYLTIEPATELRLSAQGNDLVLTGRLLPGSVYALELGAGLPADDEAVLRERWMARVSVPDLEPSIDFQSAGMFLPRSGSHAVALEAVNVPRARLTFERIYLNNLFHLFQAHGFPAGGHTYEGWRVSSALGDRLIDRTIEIGGGRNEKRVVPIDVDRLLGTAERGLYRLAVNRPGEWQASQRLLLLTDLGVVAKRSADGFLAWVTTNRTLAPVAGAKVTLFSRQNQTLATGRTDADGIWRATDLRESFRETEPYLATVEHAGDFSFVLLDRMAVDTTGLDVGGASSSGDGYSAFLYGERDLYRPGETVEGLAILRDDALAVPPAMPAVLLHRDPTGVEREALKVMTDAGGLAEFRVEIPHYALTGGHALEMRIGESIVGRYRFQVEEFVPDRIKVEIRPERDEVGPGQELIWDVSSSYLFGPPAAGLPVETRVRIADGTFAPAGFEQFVFRNPERTIARHELFEQQALLDDLGVQRFAVAIPLGVEVPSALDATVIARVSERGGRGVTAVKNLRIHPYPYYVGLRRSAEGHVEPGKNASFEFVAVASDGKPVEQGGLRVELIRDRWHTVLRRLPSGNFRYESTRDAEVVESRAVAAGSARGTFEFRIPEHGSYRVAVTDVTTSASAQLSFHASGWGYAPWAVGDPSRIELELDQDEYRPGQTAKVLVKAPFSGKLLLTVERDRVFHTSIHTLDGNTASIDLTVAESLRPNAYVTATLVRRSGDLEPGGVGRAFGAVPIRVDRASNRLQPKLHAAERVRSESRLEIEVEAPPRAVVTIAAVDEGILQLVAQRTPDPFEHFYRKLALGTGTFDTYALLLPQVKLDGRAETGGGDGGAGLAQYLQTESVRRVEPVAFWSGPVVTGANGRAQVAFELPEFQGALRLMAIAVDGRRFGSDERQVRVRDPIVVTPTYPRFLAPGETLRVPVTVRNDSGSRADLSVELAVTGAAHVAGAGTRTVTLDDGGESTIYFDAATGAETGSASFVVRATGNGVSTKSSAELPVRADLPRRSETLAGSFAERRMTLAPEDAWARSASITRSLRIGPSPLVQFAGRLEGLLRYPYGCLEQTVSTSFPLLYLEDLAASLDPELFGEGRDYHSPAEFVQAGVRGVEGFRLDSGGFALWRGSGEPHPWGSLYATHFLVEARQAGYAVSDVAIESALGWLGRSAQPKAEYGTDERKRVVYALWVLARADRADAGTLDFLREKHAASMTGDERAMLAAAFAHAGNPGAVDELLREIERVETVTRRTGGNLDSELRYRALLLLALLDARPDDARVAGFVDRLARSAAATPYWSTQDGSFTFLALGRFYRRQAERPPYSGVVRHGGRTIGRFTNETTTFDDLPATGPIEVELDVGYEPGAAFYSLTTRGVPSDAAYQPESAGLEVERVFLDRDGNPQNLDTVRQGDLIVIRTRVRSVAGPVQNVVVSNLLPSGLEVENPRLDTTETLPWIASAGKKPDHVDLRDDRILMFLDLPANAWQSAYALVRAVTPGRFRLPPIQAEAMYDGALRASGPRATLEVQLRD